MLMFNLSIFFSNSFIKLRIKILHPQTKNDEISCGLFLARIRNTLIIPHFSLIFHQSFKKTSYSDLIKHYLIKIFYFHDLCQLNADERREREKII